MTMEELRNRQTQVLTDLQHGIVVRLEEKLQPYQDVFQEKIETVFQNIQQQITSRPLFIMFEKELNCNVKTDHLFPKNIYPIFEKIFFDYKKDLVSSLVAFHIQQKYQIVNYVADQLKSVFNDLDSVMSYLSNQESIVNTINKVQTT